MSIEDEVVKAVGEIFEEAKKVPTKKELEKTRFYFGELTDALHHYSSLMPPGTFYTLTARTSRGGEPEVELVSETRFPPLDEIKEHFIRLRFAVKQLDKIPAGFWELILHGERGDTPYVSMQQVLYGAQNNGEKHFFTNETEFYELRLANFSWRDSRDPNFCRDNAEQCFRMAAAYLALNDYFKKRGLPEGAEDFCLLPCE